MKMSRARVQFVLEAVFLLGVAGVLVLLHPGWRVVIVVMVAALFICLVAERAEDRRARRAVARGVPSLPIAPAPGRSRSRRAPARKPKPLEKAPTPSPLERGYGFRAPRPGKPEGASTERAARIGIVTWSTLWLRRRTGALRGPTTRPRVGAWFHLRLARFSAARGRFWISVKTSWHRMVLRIAGPFQSRLEHRRQVRAARSELNRERDRVREAEKTAERERDAARREQTALERAAEKERRAETARLREEARQLEKVAAAERLADEARRREEEAAATKLNQGRPHNHMALAIRLEDAHHRYELGRFRPAIDRFDIELKSVSGPVTADRVLTIRFRPKQAYTRFDSVAATQVLEISTAAVQPRPRYQSLELRPWGCLKWMWSRTANTSSNFRSMKAAMSGKLEWNYKGRCRVAGRVALERRRHDDGASSW